MCQIYLDKINIVLDYIDQLNETVLTQIEELIDIRETQKHILMLLKGEQPKWKKLTK